MFWNQQQQQQLQQMYNIQVLVNEGIHNNREMHDGYNLNWVSLVNDGKLLKNNKKSYMLYATTYNKNKTRNK